MTTIILSEWNKYEYSKPNDEQIFQYIFKIDPIKLSTLTKCKYTYKYNLSDSLIKIINSKLDNNINKYNYNIIDIISPSGNYIKYLIIEKQMKYNDVGITINLLCNNDYYLDKLYNTMLK